MNRWKLVCTVLIVVGSLLGGKANAQSGSTMGLGITTSPGSRSGYTSGRSASMDPYAYRLSQAQIVARAKHALLQYHMLRATGELNSARLHAMAEDPYTRSVFARRDYQIRYDALEGLTATITDNARDVIESSLESIVRRSRAGERWDPYSADRVLSQIEAELVANYSAMCAVERATERMRQRAVLQAPSNWRPAQLSDGSYSTRVYIGSRYDR